MPGWGHQLEAERVLTEMRDVGLAATEFGPDGFLPDDPAAKAATLAEHGLAAVGGFVPVLLHDPDHDPLPGVDGRSTRSSPPGPASWCWPRRAARTATTRGPSWTPPTGRGCSPTSTGWPTHAAGRGVRACLHPHVGTMVETADDVRRVLEGSAVPLCLDTGHLLSAAATRWRWPPTRPTASSTPTSRTSTCRGPRRVQSGESTYTAAVAAGMYRPLGQGDVDVAAIVTTLEAAGYDGWYVMEQDTVLGSEAGR